ncbi:fimbrial biogenesis chaperone [Erythrobacter litoralis]|uniref:fimbrial biogenesis chaperone n=1 Tax=Erythrobacter litoralis TaxID=39960 RepID=UPI0024358ABC|nr:fimbria/pilus periplasmic chaperone [Erythrobacter litoralis]
MKRILKAAAALCAVVAVPAALSAYSVSPLRIQIEPTGGEATGRLTINNTDAKPATLSMTAFKVLIDENGSVTREETNDLLVFPPQAILKPGAKQAVQIRFRGDPATKSALYNVLISQVPVVANDSEEAQLKVGVRFFTAVVVEPNDAAGQLEMTGSEPVAGTTKHRLTFVNRGNGIARLADGVLQADAGGSAVEVSDKALMQSDTSYVMPGATRYVELDMGDNAGAIAANGFTYSPTAS